MKQSHFFRLVAMVAAMLCALSASAAEAYANYTPSNTTLTFYYDNQRSSRTGTTYDLGTEVLPNWYNDGTYSNVTAVVFAPSFANARPTITSCWFFEMSHLQSITGMEYFNTSEVTAMISMFEGCSSLTSLDLSHFNTAKVTTMAFMFAHCNSLTSLDLSSFNTANVAYMSNMFSYNGALRTIYVSDGWNTSSASSNSSRNMFLGSSSLVGGQGTTYDADHLDKAYAHIDGGASNPGYFTAQGAEPWVVIEAYACYTPDNTTLTFYCDDLRSTRTGTTYDLNTGHYVPRWYQESVFSNLTQVVFDPSFANARPTSTYSWVSKMENLVSITGMEYLNTSEVTDMGSMFAACEKLETLDLSQFNTMKVTNMDYMFCWCYYIQCIDMSSFNTSNVTNMNAMFGACYNLTTIYVGTNWTTSGVSQSDQMFAYCISLVGGQGTPYDADHEDAAYAHIDGGTSNPGYFTAQGAEPWVNDEAYACYTPGNTTLTFYYDKLRSTRTGTTYELNEGDYSPDWRFDGTNANVTQVVFDPSFADARPTSTLAWFMDMTNLRTITGMEYLNTSEVTDMSSMFEGCYYLASLDLSHFNTAKVTDMSFMFHSCYSMGGLDLGTFNTSRVTSMYYMFGGDNYLSIIYVGDGWNMDAVKKSDSMFHYCINLVGGQGTTFDSNHTNGDYAHVDGGTSNPGYFTAEGEGPWAEREAYACYTSSNKTLTFYCDRQRGTRTGVTYNLNTGTNSPMWSIIGTNANILHVIFDPSFAIARPTTTRDWFGGMTILESITGLEYLNTSEVTDMSFMFSECNTVTSLDLSGFNTSSVTDMRSMFQWCNALTSLDLSGFNTSHVTDMSWMFNHCIQLTSLDLGDFNTSRVTDMSGMFATCYALETIYVGDEWSMAAVINSDDMFYNSRNLVGGQGTTYDSNHINGDYAHVDGGTSHPGYFTEKPSSAPYDFFVDGLFYKYDGYGTVKVVNDGNEQYGCYRGTLSIPETVTYDGWTYTVTGIGERAFFRCPSLKKVIIPFTVDRIESEAFVDAFSEFTDQSSIVCLAMTPPSVSSTAFDDVYSADMTLYVPYGSKSAYQAANYWNWFGSIQELNYSFVENRTYYKVTGDGTVSVTYKDDNYDTYSSRKIIPETVTKGDVTYTVTAIDNLAFFNCAGLLSVKIPETVTSIGNRAFKDCTSLTRITVPNSVTFIGMNAFDGCTSLAHVTLGSGLRTIAGSAFYACPALEDGDIIVLATTPPSLTPSAFYNNQYGRTIVYVPKGCLSAYQNHSVWSRFASLREFTSLDEALNVQGGTISFSTWEDYPWTAVEDGGRVYAKSSNDGVPNSISLLIATVIVPEGGATLSFDFLALGDGWGSNAEDRCTFSIDGREEFTEGEIPYWETYEVELTAGYHSMSWSYTKNASIDPQGDYFAIDNVCLTPNQTVTLGDVNGDGRVDVSDVTALISKVLGNQVNPFNADNADINGDNRLDVSDVTALIAMVLNS